MGRIIAGMTMSLDGFVADDSGSGGALFADFEALMQSPAMEKAIAETGAVVMGRTTFANGDPDSYVENYEFQVPLFILTSQPPAKTPRQDERLTITFITDGIEAAVAQARAAASDRDVQIVGGASVIQQALRAGLVEELQLDIAPVLLGSGLRLLEHLDPTSVGLSLEGIDRLGDRASLRYLLRR